MSKIDNKISKLEEQLENIKSQLVKLNNTKRDEEKKLLLRKQLLIGEIIWELMSKDDQYRKEILKLVEKNIKKPSDKKLFGLPIGLIKPVENLSSDPFNSPDVLTN
ncbi:hypothetical protein [uncultured Cycloclasticus sp.]|uniref:hypothetical protein n=1 Tax=uncultured Cycloclasticus sp. TaxID=172194 RepID=UPI002588DFCD|nr:hypothetical protein [uncultured Cycloclasticus sp.]